MFGSLTTRRTTAETLAREFDAGEFSPPTVVRVLEELGVVRRLVDGMVAKAGLAVSDSGAHLLKGERNAAVMVARSLGVGAGEARSAIDTARKLEVLPATEAAVRRGALSARQAQMIAEAAVFNPDAEQQLLAAAEQGLVPLKDACVAARAAVEDPAERSARQRTLRSLRTWTDGDGMVAGSFRLTPEVGGGFKARLDGEVQRIFRARRAGTDHEPHEAYAADALAAFVLGDGEGAPARGVKYTVHVVIDHAALVRGGTAGGETCEIPGVGPVDVAWVRELLGSAFVTAVITKGKDIRTVAHLGRHIPAEIQTALLVSGRECDCCDHRGYLERDHTIGVAQGGPTAWWNLGWLCSVHHRLKTQGWTLGPRDPTTGKRTLRPPPARAA